MALINASTIVLCVASIASFWVGYETGDKKRLKLVSDTQIELISQYEDAKKKAKEYEEISIENYKKYQEAVNRPPTVVTDRVLVKASCSPSLPTDTGGGVGDGGREGYAELHRETIARITAVTDEAESRIGACSAKLNSLQEKIKSFNGDK